MRKFLSFFLLSLMFLASSPMMFAAADNKDNKDGKGKPDKGHEPIFLPVLVWNGAWSPVMREAPMENSTSTLELSEESNEIL